MEPLSHSFSLCPVNGLSLDDVKENNFNSNVSSEFNPIQNETNSLAWGLDPDAPLAFRASPFEPMVHERNLPKSGTISPLDTAEYRAWKSRAENNQGVADASRALLHDPQEESIVGSLIETRRLPDPWQVKDISSFDETDQGRWMDRFLKSEVSRTELRMDLLKQMEQNRKLRVDKLALQREINSLRSAERTSTQLQEENTAEENAHESDLVVASNTKSRRDQTGQVLPLSKSNDSLSEPSNSTVQVETHHPSLPAAKPSVTDECKEEIRLQSSEVSGFVNCRRGGSSFVSVGKSSSHDTNSRKTTTLACSEVVHKNVAFVENRESSPSDFSTGPPSATRSCVLLLGDDDPPISSVSQETAVKSMPRIVTRKRAKKLEEARAAGSSRCVDPDPGRCSVESNAPAEERGERQASNVDPRSEETEGEVPVVSKPTFRGDDDPSISPASQEMAIKAMPRRVTRKRAKDLEEARAAAASLHAGSGTGKCNIESNAPAEEGKGRQACNVDSHKEERTEREVPVVAEPAFRGGDDPSTSTASQEMALKSMPRRVTRKRAKEVEEAVAATSLNVDSDTGRCIDSHKEERTEREVPVISKPTHDVSDRAEKRSADEKPKTKKGKRKRLPTSFKAPTLKNKRRDR